MSRDYAKEYREHGAAYQARPEQVKRRTSRNAARRLMVEKGLASKGDGKDVDHRNRNPLNNSLKNLRVTSQKTNRGWNRKESDKK